MKQSPSPSSSSSQPGNPKNSPNMSASKQELAEALSGMPRDLGRSMSGADVLVLQNALVALGYLKVSPDGNFGSATENAVVEFKIANRLATDRNDLRTKRVGSNTRIALRNLLLAKATAPVTPSHASLSKTMTEVANAVRAQSVPSVTASATRTPRQAEIIREVMGQYDSSVATWAKLKIPTKGIQTKQEVSAWLESVPGKTLENLASYGPVRLKFVPPVSVAQLATSIAKSKIIPRRESVYIQNDGTWNTGSDVWEFGLTADVEDISLGHIKGYGAVSRPEDSDLLKTEEVFRRYQKRFAAGGLSIMPQAAYLPSVIDARIREIIFDGKNSSTLFEALSGEELGHLPAATHEDNCIILGGKDVGGSAPGSYCRPWIGRSKKITLSQSVARHEDAVPQESQSRSSWVALRAKFAEMGSRLSALAGRR